MLVASTIELPGDCRIEVTPDPGPFHMSSIQKWRTIKQAAGGTAWPSLGGQSAVRDH